MIYTQETCPYCHSCKDFKSFGFWQGFDFVPYMWSEGWKTLINSREIVNPEKMRHGRPYGSSMMICRQGVQKSSAMLYHMDPNYQGDYAGIAASLTQVNYCPKCGRKLTDEAEGKDVKASELDE